MATDTLQMLDKAIRFYCPGAIEMFDDAVMSGADCDTAFSHTFNRYIGDIVQSRCLMTLPMMEGYLTWRMSKVVYRFDNTLTEELLSQEISVLPSETLMHMPQYCICIADPPEPGIQFLFVSFFKNDNHMSFLWVCKDGTGGTSSIMLCPGCTIEECYNAFGETAQRTINVVTGMTAPADRPITAEEKGRMERALKLVIYLCADNAEVKTDRPKVPRMASPRDPNVHTLPKRPTYYDVGTRIGSVIRKAKADAANAQTDIRSLSGSPRRSPIPHVRSAHYATYWTGEGRKVPVVHWIEPIFVGYRDVDELPTTIRQVKK